MSVVGKRKPAAEAEQAGDENTQQAGNQMYFPETQPSQNAAVQQRKASMVQVGVHRRVSEGGTSAAVQATASDPLAWITARLTL
jgi:hypothetical protein